MSIPVENNYCVAFLDSAFAAKVKMPERGWRKRRVGEVVKSGDLRLIDDWGTCRPVGEDDLSEGDKVLGSRDGFNDVVFTPRKRKARL